MNTTRMEMELPQAAPQTKMQVCDSRRANPVRRVIVAGMLTLAVAGGATLVVAPLTATPAQAFGLGDVWDAAKEVAAVPGKVTGAARDARNKVQNTVRDAVGGAVKEVGGKVYDSIKDKVPSGVKRLGNDMKGAGELVGKIRDDMRSVKGLPGRAYDRYRKYCPKIVGCDFEPVAGPPSESSPYKPGEWGGNAAPLGSLGPTKSQAVAGNSSQAKDNRVEKALWKNGTKALDSRTGGNKPTDNRVGKALWKNGTKALESRTGNQKPDNRVEKALWKNADKALRQRAERNKTGTQSAVTKGTDTGNPYPDYPNRRPYPDYPNKKPSQVHKPGKGPATKPANVARDRSAAGRPIGEVKGTVARDRSAMGRPIGKLKDRVPRDRSVLGRTLGKDRKNWRNLKGGRDFKRFNRTKVRKSMRLRRDNDFRRKSDNRHRMQRMSRRDFGGNKRWRNRR